MISRQVLDNGKVTSLTKCKHFGFVQRKQNASAMERGKQTNCQRTKKAKSCGVCPGTFKMSGSSAIQPLLTQKPVLSKGLNFVPITKRTNEFSIKQDVEKFLRRVQLKAFFHDKEDDSDTSNKDIFQTLLVRKSKWTPPEGQFAFLDFFTKKCCHDIHKLKFNCNTKFSNLSLEEWAALKNLSKRNDIVVKSADKGAAVVVWRSDLYQKEALRNFRIPRFMPKSLKISLPKIKKLSKTPFKIL